MREPFSSSLSARICSGFLRASEGFHVASLAGGREFFPEGVGFWRNVSAHRGWLVSPEADIAQTRNPKRNAALRGVTVSSAGEDDGARECARTSYLVTAEVDSGDGPKKRFPNVKKGKHVNGDLAHGCNPREGKRVLERVYALTRGSLEAVQTLRGRPAGEEKPKVRSAMCKVARLTTVHDR
jgi:hypothetical protein